MLLFNVSIIYISILCCRYHTCRFLLDLTKGKASQGCSKFWAWISFARRGSPWVLGRDETPSLERTEHRWGRWISRFLGSQSGSFLGHWWRCQEGETRQNFHKFCCNTLLEDFLSWNGAWLGIWYECTPGTLIVGPFLSHLSGKFRYFPRSILERDLRRSYLLWCMTCSLALSNLCRKLGRNLAE